MNYYERHLGDYARDTAHLSMLEHGVYNLLLDRYYTAEQGIPADQAYRLARARTRDERAAVDSVLGEFFELVDGIYVNRRCEEEIAKFREGEPDREAKRENARDRKRRSRDRRQKLFDDLRSHNIVPAFDTPMGELQQMLSRVRSRVTGAVTDAVTDASVTGDGTSTQTPDTSSKEAKAKAAPLAPVVDFRADLFARWKSLPDGGGGAYLAKLLKDHKPEQRVLEAVELTLTETRADPKGFVQAVLRKDARQESDHDSLMSGVL